MQTLAELLSDEEMKALPRKAGRLKYEEALRLAQEMKDAQEEHERGIVYEPSPVSACPHCRPTPPWREVDVPCAEMVELRKAVDAWAKRAERGENRLNDYAALNKRDQHERTCTRCTFTYKYYDGYFSCMYRAQLNNRWRIYIHRVNDIELKQMRKRFEQEHGRTPQDILEFSDWADRVGWPQR